MSEFVAPHGFLGSVPDHRNIQGGQDIGHAEYVVSVGMGQHDGRHGQTCHGIEYPIWGVAGIDHQRLVQIVQDPAVGLQRPHDDTLDHPAAAVSSGSTQSWSSASMTGNPAAHGPSSAL